MKKRKRRPGRLEHTAYYDELCGCSNLPKFKMNVQRFIGSHPGESAFMAKFDIREFKLINRILGEKTGNQILVQIASVLRQVIRPGFFYPLKLVSGRCQMSFEMCKSAAKAVEKANIAHSKAKELGLESCEYDEEFVWQALWKREVENQLEPALEHGGSADRDCREFFP